VNKEDAVQNAKTLTELAESYKDLCNGIKGTSRETAATNKLWREGNKSRLIQIGMALIVLPEPTPVTPTIGACFIAAGIVQKGIQNQSIFLGDIKKTLETTLREIYSTRQSLQVQR